MYLLWITSSFFITSIFCQNLRSVLIYPEIEAPVEDHYKDIRYDRVKIALDFGKYACLSVHIATTVYSARMI